MRCLGFDFGTTNTVIARIDSRNAPRPIVFNDPNGAFSAFRSALCFWQQQEPDGLSLQHEAGPWAIQQFIDNPYDCRFMQSIKSFAASPHFQGTYIYAKRFIFEELLAAFFERVRFHAASELAELPTRVVIGRPVRYVGSNPDPELAMRRYEQALAQFGFHEAYYVYEPVAAAFYYAQRLAKDAVVLVADFGGGTTDYSIMQFEVAANHITSHALSHKGVDIAGDNFDYRIIDALVSPALGKGTRYHSMGKMLQVPNAYYASFARWNLLSVMKTSKEFADLKRLVNVSEKPELLENFVSLIESDCGYPLYKAVSQAKERLSKSQTTTFEFSAGSFGIKKTIDRSDFEKWIADDLFRIEAVLDDVLSAASLSPERVDKVFLTGGSSFIPALRRIFERRFGIAKIESGDELLSIANGLALIGEREDIDAWSIRRQELTGASG